MQIRFFFPFLLMLSCGCSGQIGEICRDAAQYKTIKSRMLPAAVKHFPDDVPPTSKMNASSMPLQGGDALHVEVKYDADTFGRLLAETRKKGYEETHGVDDNDPNTYLSGSVSPQICVDGKSEIPKPSDVIFTIENGLENKIQCGLTFRTDRNSVVYWSFVD